MYNTTMMRFVATALCLFVPLLSGAQNWRVQASGGISTASAIGRPEDVAIGPQNSGQPAEIYRTSHLPNDNAVFGAWGLALFRKTGNLELGLQLESMAVRTKHIGASTSSQGSQGELAYTVTGYAGRPVVPVTAICNYYAGSKRGTAYIGCTAGAAYAAGERQIEFSEMQVTTDMRLYYNTTWGFTAGIQAGYRREVGAMDFGLQLQCKYMQFRFTHGYSEETYASGLIVPAAQLYAGYRFGQRKKAPPPAAPQPE